jgi:hypothetical protein
MPVRWQAHRNAAPCDIETFQHRQRVEGRFLRSGDRKDVCAVCVLQVRLLTSNLTLDDLLPVRDKLADALFAGEIRNP